ncbi:MAG: phosphoglycerate dehydrogenase [Armatimonadota bacterium]
MEAKILVCDKIATEGIRILESAAEVVQARETLSEDALCEKVCAFDALVVRSATKVTGKVIESGSRLRVIGRAGVGVDNIDVDAATNRGVIVVNSPEGNTMAAAEHAVAMMLSLARNIPQADASMKRGLWEKSKFMGAEVNRKTLGVIGVGKIGALVAERAKGLGMRVIGTDPMLTAERAKALGIERADLPDLLREADFITVHAAKTPDTINLISDEEFALMKPTARLINCARGGIVDEDALYRALSEGRIAGAALDVFADEPPEDSPLPGLPNVIATPHLGASTAEAQVNVAVDVAEQIVTILNGGQPRTPVNVPVVPSEVMDRLAPYMHLLERMGRLQSQLHDRPITRVELAYQGEIAESSVAPLTPSFLVGLLSRSLESAVNAVNARRVAENFGIEVHESKSERRQDYGSLITARVVSEGRDTTVAGTVFGASDARIVRIDSYRIDVVPEGLYLFAWHRDRPGVIGTVGTLLGNENINIAGMQLGRECPGGRAVFALGVDQPIPEPLVKRIAEMEGVEEARLIALGDPLLDGA